MSMTTVTDKQIYWNPVLETLPPEKLQRLQNAETQTHFRLGIRAFSLSPGLV